MSETDLRHIVREFGCKKISLADAMQAIKRLGAKDADLRKAILATPEELAEHLKQKGITTNRAAARYLETASDRNISRWKSPAQRGEIPVYQSRRILGIREDDWHQLREACIDIEQTRDVPDAPDSEEPLDLETLDGETPYSSGDGGHYSDADPESGDLSQDNNLGVNDMAQILTSLSSQPVRITLRDIKTGADFDNWLTEFNLDTGFVASTINYHPLCVKRWASSGGTPMNKGPLRALIREFNDDGTTKHPIEQDGDRNDFIDEIDSRHFPLDQAKQKFNKIVTDDMNAVCRIVYTNTHNSPHLSRGAIWMASDQHGEKARVGDKLLRRLVTDYHGAQREDQFYWFLDPDTNGSYRVFCRNVENDKGKDTRFCILLVATSDDNYLPGNAELPADAVRDYLRTIRAL